MRWLTGLLFVIFGTVLAGYIFVKGYPYHLYSSWMEGENWNRYYSIQGHRSLLLKPIPIEEVPPYKEDYPQLWREFPLRNSLTPLPVRHPLFQVVPLVEHHSKSSGPQIGMMIHGPKGRELSRLYTVAMTLFPDYSLGQDLFKLPFVRNRIMKKNLDDLWKDIFTHEIKVESKSMDEMIHDLYILHIRSRLLPKETIRYGLMKDNKAVIELASRDKDYQVELVLTQDSGSIYSYVLRTEKSSEGSRQLRSKFLNSISFSPVDAAMGRLLYTEFKQLNFARQVDQEGMLYLFSAWTQSSELDLLKEMIFYLERGRKNAPQLNVLYSYAYKRYGKTFTTRKILNEHADTEINLQRKIELENIEKKLALEREKIKTPLEPELSPDEKMNYYLKQAKEAGPSEEKEMTIH